MPSPPPARLCKCPVCEAEAAAHLLATGRDGPALAVLRGLPGAIAVGLEDAREEGRREGVERMRDALLRDRPGEAGRPSRKSSARGRGKKARQGAVAPS